MSIYAPLTNVIRSTEEPLAPGVSLAADGQALVTVNTNGSYGVKPAAGSAGEVFAGFVNAQTSAVPFLQGTATKVQTLVLNAGGVASLAKKAIAGTVSVFNLTAGAPVASADFSLAADGTTLTSSGNAGATVSVTYTYALTVLEARSLFGDIQPGGYAGHTLGQTGVAKQGRVYTDQFDTAVNWRAATGLKLAAGGKLTDQTGSGTLLKNATIVSIPTEQNPFLGVEFVAPSA